VNPPPARLLRLHLRSRRTTLAAGLVVAAAALLRLARPWTLGDGEFAQLLPLVLAVAAAASIAASTRSPFAEQERTTDPLPRLRLTHALLLLALAAPLMALARLGTDPAAAARNVAGLTGLALLAAPLLGATLAWIPPLAYVIYCGGPLDIHHVTLSAWPALPSSSTAAALIAALLLLAGLAVTYLTGSRDHRIDPL
jgi:hypothetical protein